MESEQLQNFNERLSQWVANQGFWFQVRYSMAGSGMKGRALFHLLRMGFRMLIFLLLLAVGVWIFLIKRSDMESFAENLRSDLQSALSASDFSMRKPLHSQGMLEISLLGAEGGDATFFSSLEARNIRCKMGLLDGMAGVWKPGNILVSRLEIELRAGSDDAEAARKMSEVIFRKSPRVEADSFEVADATLRWGFSERTRGAIESSALKMQRTEAGWRMNFRGGYFSQNWLNRLEIVNLVVLCDPEGLLFEKAELKQGGGTVDFSGLRVIGGERPETKGVARIRHLNLENTLPASLRTFVEGSISGDFQVSGSTNSPDGIGFEGQVMMDGEDTISLRQRILLLKALSDVDYSRNYHRVDFSEGSFHVKTTRGGMELRDVKLKTTDPKSAFTLFTLEGQMDVRLPTHEEIQEAMSKGGGTASSPIFSRDDELAEQLDATKTDKSFTVKSAAMAANRLKEGQQSPDSLSLFERLGLSIEMRRLRDQEAERMSQMLRYDGMFRVTIPADAFDRAPRLRQMYPLEGGRIALRVPIEGVLYDLTLKQAEEIYQMRQH